MSDNTTDQGRTGPSDAEILAALPPRPGGREARLGLFVLIGLVSFVVVLFWMTDPAWFRGRYKLVTTMEDAGGVRGGDPVSMRGIIIGRVHDFGMDASTGLVAIQLELYDRWQVPLGSEARLGTAGIFGGRTLEIEPSNSSENHQPNDTIASSGTAAADLLGAAGDLSVQAGDVMTQIQALLNAETIEAVQGSAAGLETVLTEMSDGIREQRTALQALTNSLTRSAEGIEEATTGPELARAIARADSAMATLTETGTNLDAAVVSLRSVMAKIHSGEGTLGKLVSDDALYLSLTSATESLTAFLDDLQANPSKYINISIF